MLALTAGPTLLAPASPAALQGAGAAVCRAAAGSRCGGQAAATREHADMPGGAVCAGKSAPAPGVTPLVLPAAAPPQVLLPRHHVTACLARGNCCGTQHRLRSPPPAPCRSAARKRSAGSSHPAALWGASRRRTPSSAATCTRQGRQRNAPQSPFTMHRTPPFTHLSVSRAHLSGSLPTTPQDAHEFLNWLPTCIPTPHHATEHTSLWFPAPRPAGRPRVLSLPLSLSAPFALSLPLSLSFTHISRAPRRTPTNSSTGC